MVAMEELSVGAVVISNPVVCPGWTVKDGCRARSDKNHQQGADGRIGLVMER